MVTKAELHEEIKKLGGAVKQSLTKPELEAELATLQQIKEQRNYEREGRPGIVTTSTFQPEEPNLEDGDHDDDETEEQVYVGPRTDDSPSNDKLPDPAPTEDADEDRNAVKNLPNPTHDEQVEEDKVVVRYKRDVGSYTIGRLRFSPNSPFHVVGKDFADKYFFEGHPDVRRATPEEVKEYYNA